MYRALIAVVIVAVVGFGGYLLYQEYSEPGSGVADRGPTGSNLPESTGTIPSPPVDVDALLARLPQGSTGKYAAKSYDPGSGITTIEGLEFTVVLPEPEPPLPPPPPGAPLAPEPTIPPQEQAPPGDQNGNLETDRHFGALAPDSVKPANLAPPVEEPDNIAPPLTDPLDPFSAMPSDMPFGTTKVLKVMIGRTLLRGLDVEAFETVFDSKRYTATRDETFRPLFDTVTLSGVKLVGDGKEFGTIATVDARQLIMKQFGFIPGGPDFEKQFVSEELMGIQIIGMVADALKVGGVAIKNFRVFADEPTGKFEYSWENYEVTAIDRGRFGRARSQNIAFNMSDPASGMTLQSVQESQESEGADFSRLVPYMIKAEMPPVTATNLLSIGAGSAKNLKYVMPGYGEYAITELRSEPITFEWLIPSSLRFNAKGIFKADPKADPMAADFLAQLGQTDFPFDMALTWTYEGTGGNAKLESFAYHMAGLYGFDLGIGLAGMKLSEFATQEQMEKMMGELLFAGLTLVIKDSGGTEKMVKIFAKQNQMPEADARELLKQQALAMAMSDPPDPTLTAIANAVAQFIANPGTLTISAIPAQPVPFMLLMMQSEDPMAMTQTLNVKVEATNP